MLSPAAAAPLSPAEVAAALAPLGAHESVLLAVSGGPDSVALLVLAARHFAGAAASKLAAATVDHRLRAESAAEAERVARLCAGLGIPHCTLAWEGTKPVRGLEAKARQARYRLLTEAARALGCTAIATAHTLDDQAETVLLRLAAGSGPAGLAAMRSVSRRGSLLHLRPLLAVEKARLVSTLQAEAVPFAEDAMNADPAFARARLRASRAALEGEGLTAGRLATLARRMARVEDALEVAVAEARPAVCREGTGGTALAGVALLSLPDEIALRLLGAAIGESGAGPVRLARLESLFERCREALRTGRSLSATLAGAKVSVRPDGSILVTRAPPRRAAAAETPSSSGLRQTAAAAPRFRASLGKGSQGP